MRKDLKLFRSYISLRSVWNVATLLLRSNYGAYIGEGPEVKAFEREFGERFGFKNVATVNSGTAALELAYELAEVKAGDEVIMPVLTHPATGLPAVHRGARVVFADIERDLNVSVEDVARKITPKTKAILFVHFGGNNRGLRELLDLAREKNLILIEDAAQAVGSEFWGKADFTCVSFQAIKMLTTGDGGAIMYRDEGLDKKARRLRWFGYDRELKQKIGDTDITEAGYKYHMNDINAAIGRGNLRSIDRIIRHSHALMAEYAKHGVAANPWFAYILAENREGLIAYLKERGVASGTYHYRNDKYTIFGGITPGALPVMDEVEEKYLLLPLNIGISASDVRTICRYIEEFNNLEK